MRKTEIKKTMNVSFIGDIVAFSNFSTTSHLSNINMVHIDIENFNISMVHGYYFSWVIVDKYAITEKNFGGIYNAVLSRIR